MERTHRKKLLAWFLRKRRVAYIRRRAGYYLPTFIPENWLDHKVFL